MSREVIRDTGRNLTNKFDRQKQMSSRAIIEFIFEDGWGIPVAEFDDKLTMSLHPDNKREAIVFTVINTEGSGEPPCFQYTSRDVFKDVECLTTLIYELTSHQQVESWFISYDESDQYAKWLREAVFQAGMLWQYREIPVDPLAYYCGKLSVQSQLPISPEAGLGHFMGFKVVTATPDSTAARVMQSIPGSTDSLSVLHEMLYTYEWCLQDSFIEMMPFGDEDREHVCIVVDRCRRDEVVATIKDVYCVPYYMLPLTYDEWFFEWQTGRSDFRDRLVKL